MERGVFIPDRDRSFYLFARHRQPLAENVARQYIEGLTAPGDLVIDPFAASPTVPRLAAELGRRAIAVDSNPLVAFAAKVQAALPAPREIRNALARLGEIRKEDESLKAHVEQLYGSLCANCGSAVVVDYYLHALDLHAPVDKIYHCPNCGDRRDPTNDADRSRAAEIKPRGFHYHLLLERITGASGEHVAVLRELLKLYTPRNLYALVSVTLKLDAEIHDDATRQTLIACLVHALDVCSTLYASPDGLPQRATPAVFVEMNVWRALETAAAGLGDAPRGPAPAASPEQVVNSPEAALFIGQGSAHSLAAVMSPAAALVVSSPARLDPLFWQLSYLWTSWVFGKPAAQPLEALLDPEHQRWGWYGNALAVSLREAARLMRDDGTLALGFPSGSHAMIEALCLAGSPFFHLESFAFRPSVDSAGTTEFGALRGDYRVLWRRQEAHAVVKEAREVGAALRRDALVGSTEILATRGEPLAYSWVHHGALRQLAIGGALAETMVAKMPARDNAFQFLRHQLEAGLKSGYARDFDHWTANGRVLWARRQAPREAGPLADRVESVVREILFSAKRITRTELEDQVLTLFRDLLTPEIELVEICARAYAESVHEEWRWREHDRAAELAKAKRLVSELGSRMNLAVRSSEQGEEFELVWSEQKLVPASSAGAVKAVRMPEDSHGFIFPERLDLLKLVRTPAATMQGIVVIPETQVELAKEKLRRMPTLDKPLHEAGWEFIRLPYVEALLSSSSVERAEFQLGLGLEPPMAKGKEQMELF